MKNVTNAGIIITSSNLQIILYLFFMTQLEESSIHLFLPSVGKLKVQDRGYYYRQKGRVENNG
jgi:hypothetical protein